jgi:hypothetical protein
MLNTERKFHLVDEHTNVGNNILVRAHALPGQTPDRFPPGTPHKKSPHLAHNYHLPAQNCLVSNLHQTGLRFRIGNSQSRKPFLFPVPCSLLPAFLFPSPFSPLF